MAQIISTKAKPKRCNANALKNSGSLVNIIPENGEIILICSDNSMSATGDGNFDMFIIGDGTTKASALEWHPIDVEGHIAYELLSVVQPEVVILDKSSFQSGKYINSNNALVSLNRYYAVKDYDISGYYEVSIYGTNNSAAFTVLTRNGTIVRTMHISTSPTTIYPAEEGCTNISHSSNQSVVMLKGRKKEVVNIQDILTRLSALESEIDDKANTDDVFGYNDYMEGDFILTPSDYKRGYIDSSGSFVSLNNDNAHCVEKVDISSYDKIRIYGPCSGNSYNALFDANNGLIKTWHQECYTDIDIQDEGAKYLSLSVSQPSSNYHFVREVVMKTTDRRFRFRYYPASLLKSGTLSRSYSSVYNNYISEPIEVKENNIFRLHAVNDVTNGAVAIILDANYHIVKTYTASSKGIWQNVVIPADGKYVIFSSVAKDYIDIYQIDERGLAEAEVIDAGGTWQALGTSITWYDLSPQHAVNIDGFRQGYVSFVQRKLYFSKFTNTGGSGQDIPYHFDKIIFADYYTIEHGINHLNTALGTLDDFVNDTGDGTFAGLYRHLINIILGVNPSAKIILCTVNRSNYGGRDYESLKAKSDLIIQIGGYCGFPVADWFYQAGMNDFNLSQTTIDGLHPNDDGHSRMAAVLVEAFKKSMSVSACDYTSDLFITITGTCNIDAAVLVFTSTNGDVQRGTVANGSYSVTLRYKQTYAITCTGYTPDVSTVVAWYTTTLNIVLS